MTRKHIGCFLFYIIINVFGFSVYAQDPQFSQFYSSKLLLNPAFAGAEDGGNFVMNIRDQWVGVPGSFRTIAAAFDMPVYSARTRHGLGFSLLADKAGQAALTKTEALFHYAYETPLTEHSMLRFGLAGGFQQASLDFYSLRFDENFDPGGLSNTSVIDFVNNSNTTRISPEVSTGLLFLNKHAYGGVSIHHLTQPRQQFFTTSSSTQAVLYRRYSAYGGFNIPVKTYSPADQVIFSPNVLYEMQGNFRQLDLGLYSIINQLTVGMWYRGIISGTSRDALVFMVGFTKTPFSIGYSYDYTISSLTTNVSGGSHEISLRYLFSMDKKALKKNPNLPCPHF